MLLSGCSKVAEQIRCGERDPKTGQVVFDKKAFSAGSVSYHGISFVFDSSLGEIAAETRCAVTDLGKGVFYEYHPEHPAFVFNGSYADQQKDSFFSTPEIRVYRVDEYQKIVGQNAELKRFVEAGFERLRDVLDKQPTSFIHSAPFVAILEAGQLFYAKVKYVNFQNGKGILYLTYFCREAWGGCRINNQALSYIFQGLSDDGRYFIHGTFPIKANFLPLSETLSGDSGCFDPLPGATSEEISQSCEMYGRQIGEKVEALPSTDFEPPLALFDQLFKSLSITSP